MHPAFEKADGLSREAIAAAIEVHRLLGPGLLESIYEKCLLREFTLRGIPVANQERVRIEYKGIAFTEQLRFDLLVDGVLLLEVKAVQDLLLLLNFHEMKLVDGVSRMMLPGANESKPQIEEQPF